MAQRKLMGSKNRQQKNVHIKTNFYTFSFKRFYGYKINVYFVNYNAINIRYFV